jgi:hypothetical protein
MAPNIPKIHFDATASLANEGQEKKISSCLARHLTHPNTNLSREALGEWRELVAFWHLGCAAPGPSKSSTFQAAIAVSSCQCLALGRATPHAEAVSAFLIDMDPRSVGHGRVLEATPKIPVTGDET